MCRFTLLITLMILAVVSCCSHETSDLPRGGNVNESTEWGKVIGGGLWDNGFAVAVDETSNGVYLAGYMNEDVPDEILQELMLNDTDTYFISRFDGSGTLQWTKQLKIGDRFNMSAISDAACDSFGNVFILGQFKESMQFDGVNGRAVELNSQYVSMYLLAYSPSGELIWHDNWRGLDYSRVDIIIEPNYSISVDAEGNIYVAGSTSEIRKYNNDGQLLWNYYIELYILDASADIQGNYYIIGMLDHFRNEYYSNLDDLPGWNLPPDINKPPTGGVSHNYLVKISSGGFAQWVKIIDYTSNIRFAAAYDNGCYLCGTMYVGYNDYDICQTDIPLNVPGTKYFYLINIDGNGDILQCERLDLSFLWIDILYGDDCNNIYVGGHVAQNSEIFPGQQETMVDADMSWVVLKSDGDMNFRKIIEIPHQPWGSFLKEHIDMSADGCNTLYVTGCLSGDASLIGISLDISRSSIIDSTDLLIIKTIDETN